MAAGKCLADVFEVSRGLVLLARELWSCWSPVHYVHGARQIMANRCLSQFYERLGHGNLWRFYFVKGAFLGVDISIDEAIALGVVWSWFRALKTIFISEAVPFLGLQRLPIVSENFQEHSFKYKYSVRQPITAIGVVEDICKRDTWRNNLQWIGTFAIPIHKICIRFFVKGHGECYHWSRALLKV